MAVIIGRGVRVEMARTYGTALPVSDISSADPAVATSTGHALPTRSVGFFQSVEGTVQLEGQAVRLGTVDANTFVAEDIDATRLPTFTGAAEFVPVTAWTTIGTATRYAIGGGDADRLDTTTLLDEIKQEVTGQLGAQSVSFDILAEDTLSEGLRLVEAAARRASYEVFRITLKNGATRVFRGQPSLPGEDVGRGAVGTGSFTVTVKGFVTKGAPAA